MIEKNGLIYKRGESSPYTGILRDYHKNGKVNHEYNYKNGKEKGIGKIYDENSNLINVINFLDGKKAVKEYDDDGTLEKEFYLNINDELEGMMKEYYISGNIMSETNWKNGELNGLSKDYSEDGILEDETNYKDGKEDGIWRNYYNDGTICSESSYKNDELNGLSKDYYEDGTLQSEENYKNGKLDGISKSYDEKGNLISEEEYKDEKLVKKIK
jgi:antitoxin component YwqK of YwqJK toxin-antitoxin module